MNEILQDSLYFGVAISLFTYWIGWKIQQKWKKPILNPLLISMILVIVVLSVFHIEYETYQYGAKYITYFLTPATICLAVPLYRQIQKLKENVVAVIVSIFCGCLAHVLILVGIATIFDVSDVLTFSLLPKSVTTAIALGVTEEIGGIAAVTVVGVSIAGLMGAIVGPSILKIVRITEPVAQGLAIGSASHAVGTSKAVELGEVQAAMSSLSIVVTGILTVVIVPIVVGFY
ncbi:MAG: LrgB family protein [Lachnospiraceae bacterium]|nr:LrgB family protein [Lachnospiraceae bacterium]